MFSFLLAGQVETPFPEPDGLKEKLERLRKERAQSLEAFLLTKEGQAQQEILRTKTFSKTAISSMLSVDGTLRSEFPLQLI